jgi:hypothetical protein
MRSEFEAHAHRSTLADDNLLRLAALNAGGPLPGHPDPNLGH